MINCTECGEKITEINASSYYGKLCNECDEYPDGYIKPGNEATMWVNAYEVTRHCGSMAEGGDWYNHYEPLSSIPIQARSHEGHETSCGRCNDAREGKIVGGQPVTFCHWGFHLKPVSSMTVEFMKQYLGQIHGYVADGNIYSVLGGAELSICLEDEKGQPTEPYGHYE